MTLPTATPGAKMLYLIKRRPTTSREELVAHWFANHMPAVIQGQKDQAGKGAPARMALHSHPLRRQQRRRTPLGRHGAALVGASAAPA